MTGRMPSIATQRVFGVDVCACSVVEARAALLSIAAERGAATVEFLAVNNLVIASEDPDFGAILAGVDYVFPDGAPIAWLTKRSRAITGAERITARETMLALCDGAASSGVPVYFYGSTETVVRKLAANLQRRYPGLQVAGSEASVFRPLTRDEDRALVDRINRSGAGLVFVGLGCPLQEQFVAGHRESINAVQLCVGSAFKYLAGHHPIPPAWARRMGLEWLARIVREPRRLWRRYLRTNSKFVWMLVSGALRANWTDR